MEIQDRNIVLQQLLGIKQSGSSAVSGLESGFVDILKSYGAKETQLSEPEFSEAKRIAADASKKQSGTEKQADAKDIKTKDTDRNGNVKKKSAEKKEAKADKAQVKESGKKENAVSENNVSGAAVQEEVLDQAVASVPAEAEEQEVADVLSEVVAEGGAVTAVLGVEKSETPVSFMPENEENNVMPMENEVLAAGSEMKSSMPEMDDVWKNGAVSLKDTVTEHVKADTANIPSGTDSMPADMSDEDMLLMRQAKYIDDKTGGQKMKIEVSVQGENFAASVSKDMLQNRFEVDAVLRQMNSVDANVIEETDVPQTESVEAVSTLAPATDKAPVVAGKENITAVWQPSESVTQIVSDASQISLSGKEYAAEAVNGVKTEAFARINEASSRDVFKGMGKEAVEQIKINITKSAVKGADTIDIQLKPEDLGKIQIKMHISKDGRLQAEIISGRQETLDMLQKEVSGLVKAFEDAGYEADSRSFSFNFQDEKQSGGQQKDEAGLLNFIGDTLEQEADNAAGNDNLIYDPALGLNIRV